MSEELDVVSRVSDAVQRVASSERRVPGRRLISQANLENDAADLLVQEWAKRHAPTAEISEISYLASIVIGDTQRAIWWLSEPNLATDNRPPIDLIGEHDGFERVKNLLLRAEVGALA